MVFLLAIVVFGGYLLPLPFTVLSWREWLHNRVTVPRRDWRHIASTTALLALTLAIPLWSYAVVRELRNDYSYIYFSAQIGRWSSLALFLISCLAEGRCRRYLLLASVGLILFYGISIGELP
jgi:hypothetical protein